ncbi:MAG: hypothetical protein HQL16_03210 [Candidatus Omnitrophica bacterium]|nr:hypothetical protein [Candidatus Omnitrophota bacterium]
MKKIGLKLWSTNLTYIPEAQDLFAKKVFDYIELFIVPGSCGMIPHWKKLGIPYILHAPHSYAGLNPSDSSKRHVNMGLIREVDLFFSALMPTWVIFHPGVNGDINESVMQFRSFRDSFAEMYQRVLIENKPQVGLRGEQCLGASVEEVRSILTQTGLGFCLDFGHAICYAISAKKIWEQIVAGFLELNPAMFHVCDGYYSGQDAHEHLGKGQFDLSKIIKYLHSDAMLTVETKKDFPDSLDDFLQDVNFLQHLMIL